VSAAVPDLVLVRPPVRTLLVTFLCFTFAGCFPWGGNRRTIAGDFRLEQSEDGTSFYLHKRGRDDSAEGGSIIGGTVVGLGWSSRYILAQRHSIFRGDPDGWMIIDVQAGAITGPFTEAELQSRAEVRDIKTYPVTEAWSKL
jgi:hypothetical protein